MEVKVKPYAKGTGVKEMEGHSRGWQRKAQYKLISSEGQCIMVNTG